MRAFNHFDRAALRAADARQTRYPLCDGAIPQLPIERRRFIGYRQQVRARRVRQGRGRVGRLVALGRFAALLGFEFVPIDYSAGRDGIAE